MALDELLDGSLALDELPDGSMALDELLDGSMALDELLEALALAEALLLLEALALVEALLEALPGALPAALAEALVEELSTILPVVEVVEDRLSFLSLLVTFGPCAVFPLSTAYATNMHMHGSERPSAMLYRWPCVYTCRRTRAVAMRAAWALAMFLAAVNSARSIFVACHAHGHLWVGACVRA